MPSAEAHCCPASEPIWMRSILIRVVACCQWASPLDLRATQLGSCQQGRSPLVQAMVVVASGQVPVKTIRDCAAVGLRVVLFRRRVAVLTADLSARFRAGKLTRRRVVGRRLGCRVAAGIRTPCAPAAGRLPPCRGQRTWRRGAPVNVCAARLFRFHARGGRKPPTSVGVVHMEGPRQNRCHAVPSARDAEARRIPDRRFFRALGMSARWT